MNRLQKFRRKRRTRVSGVMGLTLFTVLMGVFLLGVFAFLYGTTSPGDCNGMVPLLIGDRGVSDGLMDPLQLAGLAGLGILAIMGGQAIRARQFSIGGAAFGIMNTALSCAMIFQWLVVWSFFNPWSPVAPFVMAFAPKPFVLSADWMLKGDDRYLGAPGWQEIAPWTYFNDAIGIYAREEIVKICVTPAFNRKNLSNMFPTGYLNTGERLADISDHALTSQESRFIFYDREGRYLTTERPWDHDAYPVLMKLDENRKAEGRSVDPYEITFRVKESLKHAHASDNQVQLYTREQIDEMVRQTWDREAPLD